MIERHPSEDQVNRAANLLMQIQRSGNHRPGDDLWAFDETQAIQQYRARARDMLVLMLNAEHVFGEKTD